MPSFQVKLGLQGRDTERSIWELALDKRNAGYRLLHAKLMACKAEASAASQEVSAQVQGLQAQVQQLQVTLMGQGHPVAQCCERPGADVLGRVTLGVD